MCELMTEQRWKSGLKSRVKFELDCSVFGLCMCLPMCSYVYPSLYKSWCTIIQYNLRLWCRFEFIHKGTRFSQRINLLAAYLDHYTRPHSSLHFGLSSIILFLFWFFFNYFIFVLVLNSIVVWVSLLAIQLIFLILLQHSTWIIPL